MTEGIFSMSQQEKRKFARVTSAHLLSYTCTEDGETVSHQGMGRTLNISEEGMLLETSTPLTPGTLLKINIGLEEEMIEVQGRIIHQGPEDGGLSVAGVEFLNIGERERTALRSYIAAFASNNL